MNKKQDKGFAIALAWPETLCKQAGAWYDPLMRQSGFNSNGYYRAGHSAVILVNNISAKCHYFDFGRYHAPYQMGRVRSAETDPELTIETQAVIQKDHIINLYDILSEVAERKACHGTGSLHASWCTLNFDKAIGKAKNLQENSPLPYGPFIWNGTNCSRLVRTVILAGQPSLYWRLRLLSPLTLTPSPGSNIRALDKVTVIPVAEKPVSPECNHANQVLAEPERPDGLPGTAQWLSGEGAGSWFDLKKDTNHYIITRYADDGSVEFKGAYKFSGDSDFDINKKFRFIHASHYLKCRIFQNGLEYECNLMLPEKENESFQLPRQYVEKI